MASTYVCADWFPKTDNPNDKRLEAGFPMNDYLKSQMDILIKNAPHDWDFSLLISGQGLMRVGKSVLGQQIGAYWAYQMDKDYGIKVPWGVKPNLILNGNEVISGIKGLIKETKELNKNNRKNPDGKYAPWVYDEAADDMESTKVLKTATQQIKDHLRKNAQYNMLNIIIQGEFFEIPKPIALSRSICLLDVYYVPDKDGLFQRGYFNFYNRTSKKRLYINGKKEYNYKCVQPDFYGTFPNFYTVNEQQYRQEKIDSQKRWEKVSSADVKRTETIRATLKLLYQTGLSYREIANQVSSISKFKISHEYVGKLIANEPFEDENDT